MIVEQRRTKLLSIGTQIFGSCLGVEDVVTVLNV